MNHHLKCEKLLYFSFSKRQPMCVCVCVCVCVGGGGSVGVRMRVSAHNISEAGVLDVVLGLLGQGADLGPLGC